MLVRKILALLCTLAVENGLANGLRVLGVAPLPAPSHSMQLIKLLRTLALRGHQVDVISFYPRKTPLANYTDYPIEIEPEYFLVNSATYEDVQHFASLSMNFFAKYTGTECCDYMAQPNVQKVLKKGKGTYDVIITEVFMTYCYFALGRHFNAPVIAYVSLKNVDWMFPPFGTPVNPAYIPGSYSLATQYMNFWERLQNTIFTYFVKYQFEYLLKAQIMQVEKYFGRKLASMHELFDDVALLLLNSHTSLDTIRPLTPDIIEVAGLHIVDEHQELTPDLEKWLNDSTTGCVYFSFGSMVRFETFPERIIKMFYEMFKRIAPVRVLMRIGDPSMLPSGLPKNVKTSRWLPQLAILKHRNTKAFISHGGLCSTQEGIAYKVPMVGMPLFIDQFPNVQYLVKKNIGVQVLIDDALTADSLTKAVQSVLTDPSYRKNIEKLSTLYWDRPMNALDTAVYWVEYAARHGPALKSPALKLTWWQFYLLDVYGFLLICLLLSIYMTYRVIVLLWYYLASKIQFNPSRSNNASHAKVD